MVGIFLDTGQAARTQCVFILLILDSDFNNYKNQTK